MSYEVFARKYRPQTFDDLVGQAHVTRTLKNAVEQNRLAHAYLFVGPRGIGKTSTARILAKALNCVEGQTVTPCGKCHNCVEIAAGNSLDVIEIDGASNRGIDDVRELRDNVRYAPAKARLKIYIIDEVHMLTKEAFNALLKTLEEPPPHVKFIFATTEPDKVLPTILSRCQRFDLHRIAANLIAQHLQFIAKKEKIQLAPAAANAIARGADGGLRDAESMLDQLVAFCGNEISEADVLNVFGFTSEQTVRDFTNKIIGRETSAALTVLHEQCEAGKDMMKLLSDLIAYLRDLLVFKVNPESTREEVDVERQKSFSEQGEVIDTARLLELIDQFAETETRMKWAPNKKLHFEVAVIKAIQTLGQATLDEVIENLSALRGGSQAAPSQAPRVAETGAVTTATSKKFAKNREANVAPIAGENAGDGQPLEKLAPVDADALWAKTIEKVPAKGFLRNLVDSMTVIGADGRNFLLGYPPGLASTIETLATASNRRQLEALLKDVSGRDWAVKITPKEGLPAKPAGSAASAEYKDEPLIREALEMFKGEIKS